VSGFGLVLYWFLVVPFLKRGFFVHVSNAFFSGPGHTGFLYLLSPVGLTGVVRPYEEKMIFRLRYVCRLRENKGLERNDIFKNYLFLALLQKS